MLKEIIINSSSEQTRVAITEDGNLADFFVDYPENRRMVGDVYLGKVARVLPGIKAAFIDIGMKHDAFLHFSDIGQKTKELQSVLDDDDEDDDPDSRMPSEFASVVNEFKVNAVELINGVPRLQKGQNILIQITKEPVNNKGVRVSSSISIPGRFCVLLPFDGKIGVSKKIQEYKERKRLRSIARSILPKDCGLIIRTVAKNQPEELLAEDLKYLKKQWETLVRAAKEEEPPKLVYQDLSTTISVIRDLFNSDVARVRIDSKKLYKQVEEYILSVHPEWASKVEFYKFNKPIFEAFHIDDQIRSLFVRKVSMKSGGYLIIEHTEAMVVIDVNSGKYAANKEQEMNSLRTDLEAAREISRQLRLRDIGGLIVIDFIDLEDDRNRKKVYDELKKEFRRDRAKVSVLPMSDFGIVEITRQRIRQNIMQALTEVCPSCDGSGLLVKKAHIIYDIEETFKRYSLTKQSRRIVFQCRPEVASILTAGFFNKIFQYKWKYGLFVKLEIDETLPYEKFKLLYRNNREEIVDDFNK